MLPGLLVAIPQNLEVRRLTRHPRHAWRPIRGKSPEESSDCQFAARNEPRHSLAWSLPDEAESFRIASALPPMKDNLAARCGTLPAPQVSGPPIHKRRQAPSNNSRSEDRSLRRAAD